ncbi:MAG: hypothetical protein KJO38_00950 [Gammaproteobacteria bacterium]|nr:hypothetical protein [Gammaproteobacteria bacterium]
MSRSRDELIHMVEHTYFESVRRGDMATVLACFSEDAEIRVYRGDEPLQHFAARPSGDQQPLSAYFQYVFDHYEVSYSDFEHVVEPEAERIASTFVVHLRLRQEPGAAPQSLYNCNFFFLAGGRFRRVVIHYANPG